MTDKTSMPANATKGRAAVRALRNYGILAYWDKDARELVAYVTKHGEAATRRSMLKHLDPDAYALEKAQEYFNVVAR